MKAYIFAMTLLSKIKSSRSKRKGLFAILSWWDFTYLIRRVPAFASTSFKIVLILLS
jgi:hypothetical protein